MSPQTVYRMMGYFCAISRGEISLEKIIASGLLYAVVDSVEGVKKLTWEEQMAEYRRRNEVEMGRGFGKEEE